MIAVDTNLLVYAHREDSVFHSEAAVLIQRLAEGSAPWAIPWPAIHEFLAVVTHPRILAPPTPSIQAIEQVDAWLESPTLHLLSESGRYWETLRKVAGGARTTGPQIHDARIAALCIHHGIRELWTADRDFGRFPSLKVRNPLT